MGYMRHHGILVTGWDLDKIKIAHQKAKELFKLCPVSELSPEVINGNVSFVIFPDGSKEGWDDSNIGDKERETFINYLKQNKELYLDWVLVQYGDDEHITIVLDDSDEKYRHPSQRY